MGLRGFPQLVISQAAMLRRNPSFWLTSMFTAAISMLVFGWLFNPESQAFDLGVVDEDRTESSQALVQAFAGLENVSLSREPLAEEMDAFRDGKRGAVLIVPEGFAADLSQGGASLQVYYDDSNPIRIGYVTTTVKAVVDSYNTEVTGQAAAVKLEAQAAQTRSVRFVDFLTPGMVGMTIMWVNLGVGFLMVTWREQGILRRLGVTPLRPGTLIGSQAVSFAMVSLVQVTIILLMGALIFNVEVAGSYLLLAVTVLLGVAAMLSIGYVIASLLRTDTSVNAVVNLIAFPMIFLGGSYFPLDTPSALQPLVQALPLTHLNDALREIVNHGNGLSDLWLDWAALAAWIGGGFLVSMRLFRWQ
ncbi:MAG TPA: ABC transporter permease [Dehalococcoidia bacterium]|nr:ABC transporter permease [Dehalococcoidia bacterium]